VFIVCLLAIDSANDNRYAVTREIHLPRRKSAQQYSRQQKEHEAPQIILSQTTIELVDSDAQSAWARRALKAGWAEARSTNTCFWNARRNPTGIPVPQGFSAIYH
jgi:hypothetical protein